MIRNLVITLVFAFPACNKRQSSEKEERTSPTVQVPQPSPPPSTPTFEPAATTNTQTGTDIGSQPSEIGTTTDTKSGTSTKTSTSTGIPLPPADGEKWLDDLTGITWVTTEFKKPLNWPKNLIKECPAGWVPPSRALLLQARENGLFIFLKVSVSCVWSVDGTVVGTGAGHDVTTCVWPPLIQREDAFGGVTLEPNPAPPPNVGLMCRSPGSQ